VSNLPEVERCYTPVCGVMWEQSFRQARAVNHACSLADEHDDKHRCVCGAEASDFDESEQK
jgi:hypothetical protein